VRCRKAKTGGDDSERNESPCRCPFDSPVDPARAIRFTALYDTHYHRILGYAARRIRREDAVDVAAETFRSRGAVSMTYRKESRRSIGCTERRVASSPITCAVNVAVPP
jgi:hypothetical protein